MSINTRILLYLIALAVFDTVIPVPLTALVLIYILFQKPGWFRQWVGAIYRQ